MTAFRQTQPTYPLPSLKRQGQAVWLSSAGGDGVPKLGELPPSLGGEVVDPAAAAPPPPTEVAAASENGEAAEASAKVADPLPVEGQVSTEADVLQTWLQETLNQQSKKALEPPPKSPFDVATVSATYNNTIVTITTSDGSPVNWASCGSVGFKGAKRSTSFAAQVAGQRAAEDAMQKGVERVRVKVKGLGPGRATAVKGLKMGGLSIVEIKTVPRSRTTGAALARRGGCSVFPEYEHEHSPHDACRRHAAVGSLSSRAAVCVRKSEDSRVCDHGVTRRCPPHQRAARPCRLADSRAAHTGGAAGATPARVPTNAYSEI
eukprot:CAMPEP_0182923944 /NCGR_PEP_ID=MMETSP0105_2-20130417/5751_1 /TAXON_ID=81532 ORGANISM="Acanthoeca-like sp., Strain 10tr" /NCGR_SAMPLE_ID=MMETSP0105_2 /ASSEMBLY_ACC=CAM_ASM_000205 /LENGTH=318 /DNA_ID=CAMNT_0025061693 /DNA_START=100 /DNA_END=1057 /DNA_ORIENTATION=-